MKLIEAFEYFADATQDRSWWPVPVEDRGVIAMTSAVVLSGLLNQCHTTNDLQRAVLHFIDLVHDKKVTKWDWAKAMRRTARQLSEWVDEIDEEMQLRAHAELN